MTAVVIAWVHGFGGGLFVGVLLGAWLARGNRKGADDVTTEDTRQGIHDEIVRQSGTEYYSPPLHGGVKGGEQ